MIDSFSHKGMKRLFEDNDRRLIRPDLVERVSIIFAYLDAAKTIDDLNIPSLRLHSLKGEYRGYWSVTVRANWRIVFQFDDGAVSAIELIDYH
ncbi:MAG: type II toxin-antitoxin system RelE/ParE family toxin [Hyphomicrobiales bacterium]|nr:type II toxin-antitoxin system RelE/ParE family toxin [Hyphomicrobiales bacterium]